MKTSKEFIERLQSDEAFAGEIAQAIKAGTEKDADYKSVLIAVAQEHGYKLSKEELDEMEARYEELSDEELGKVAGGTSPVLFSALLTGVASGAFSYYVSKNVK